MQLQQQEVAALVIISIGTILSIVAAAIPDWLVYSGVKYGLFRVCFASQCAEYISAPAAVRAAGAMVILGVLCDVAAVVLTCLFMFLQQTRIRTVVTAAISTSALAGVFLFIGPVIWMSYWLANGAVFTYINAGNYICYIAMVLSFVHTGVTSSARTRNFAAATAVVP